MGAHYIPAKNKKEVEVGDAKLFHANDKSHWDSNIEAKSNRLQGFPILFASTIRPDGTGGKVNNKFQPSWKAARDSIWKEMWKVECKDPVGSPFGSTLVCLTQRQGST